MILSINILKDKNEYKYFFLTPPHNINPYHLIAMMFYCVRRYYEKLVMYKSNSEFNNHSFPDDMDTAKSTGKSK